MPSITENNGYTYDAASNRTSLTAPDGSITTYGYDSDNRLNGLANWWAGSFGFSYDALSRRTQLTRPNGITTNYAYDSVSHLLSVLHQAGLNTIDGASYTYDAAGNRTSKTNYLNGITSSYAYDPLYELTQVTEGTSTTESYNYDAVGNRLSSSGVPNYNYNSSNELTSNSSGSYTYDANGNTLSDSQGRSFTWDFENRLTQAVVPGTNGGTTTFKYDPFGRRIQKSGPLGTAIYLYDGPNLLEELDQSGSVTARYTQGKELDEVLAELRSGLTSYYQQDGLGSFTSLSTSAGALANTYTYDSFGQLTTSTGTVTNPFQYAGREFDAETHLVYNRARYLDSTTGRFVGEDPLSFRAGPNYYAYVSNNPVSFIDPPGKLTLVSTTDYKFPNTRNFVSQGYHQASTREAGNNDHIDVPYSVTPDSGWHVVRNTSHLVVASQQGQWSYSFHGDDGDHVIYNVTTIHKTIGSSGSVDFAIQFLETQDVDCSKVVSQPYHMSWGDSQAIDPSISKWTLVFDSFDGSHKEFTGADTSNPYVKIVNERGTSIIQVSDPSSVSWPPKS